MDAAVLVGVAVVTTLEVRDNVFVVVVVGRRSQLQPGRRNGRAEGGRVIASHSLIVSRLLCQTRTLFLSWPSVVPPPLLPKDNRADSTLLTMGLWGGVGSGPLSRTFTAPLGTFNFNSLSVHKSLRLAAHSHYDAQSRVIYEGADMTV